MIRFATADDINSIMSFIDIYWRKSHIMSRDRKLFEFQHLWEDVDPAKQEISFVLSENEGEINGLLGYIPYDKNNRDITLAIWKTVKTKDTMQGVKILSYLKENGKVHSINAPGINAKTIPIYNFLGYYTGEMKHWYRLNRDINQTIALIADDMVANDYTIPHEKYAKIEYLKTFNDAVAFGINDCLHRKHQLYKSPGFVMRRYYDHPTYKYMIYGLSDNIVDTESAKKLVMVFRIQPCNGSKVLRLIDCIGDHELIKNSTSFVDNLMQVNNCEYIDCYVTGLPDEYFFLSGWRNVSETNNIIPEYFSPYEQKNIRIYYMSEFEDTILFKGDGDMDRPN